VAKIAQYFCDAGLKVACVLDSILEAGLVTSLCGLPCPTIFLRQKGLEDVIAESLPLDLVQRSLADAPLSKNAPLSASVVAAMAEKRVRETFRASLIDNKGSAGMHEWILSQLDETTLPPPFGDLVDLISQYLSGSVELGAVSLVR
jgi:hypothetical protein